MTKICRYFRKAPNTSKLLIISNFTNPPHCYSFGMFHWERKTLWPLITRPLPPPQHLSTFLMDKAESITTVDDAVKRLILLDSKDKIWTQEMLLQVTGKAVRLLDADTEVGIQAGRQQEVLQREERRWRPVIWMSVLQEELENFPLATIHMSQTVLNKTRYPSVLLLVCQDKDQHKPDIHFFHCDEVEVSGWLSN